MNKDKNRTIVINPSYENYTEFVNTVPDIFPNEGKVIYKQRNEIRVFNVDSIAINVKKYKVPFVLNRIVYSIFRKPKAIRAFEYARKLSELGINTADPIAYIIFNKGGLINETYFISKQIIDAEMMYDIAKQPYEQACVIFESFANFVADLHKKGVFHADLSPGNVLYKKQGDEYIFYIIDINRMSFGKISIEKGCSNFARMWANTKLFKVMAKQYAQAMGYPAEQCEKLILSARDKFWSRYRKKRDISFEYD